MIVHVYHLTQVTHGGLFKDDDVLLDDIRKVDRDRQPPEDGIHLIWLVNEYVKLFMPFAGIMCDLLWSDPQMLVC